MSLRRGMTLLLAAGLVTGALLSGPLRGAALEGSATPASSSVTKAGDAEAGKKLSVQCLGCHTIDGSKSVGPTWKDLYGSEVELEGGAKVTADEAYLTESIKDPNAKVVKGFPANAMPPYGAILSDQNIADLVAYIKTLSPKGEEELEHANKDGGGKDDKDKS